MLEPPAGLGIRGGRLVVVPDEVQSLSMYRCRKDDRLVPGASGQTKIPNCDTSVLDIGLDLLQNTM